MSCGIPPEPGRAAPGTDRQSDPELKKYLWVLIRTQKDRKLQTLIEVCTDFSSLSAPAHLHRPAEQTFAVHQQIDTPYMEDDCESEAVFAVGDRPPWTNRRPPEAPAMPTLQQMFILARRMGYEMRPISRQSDAPRQHPGDRPPVDQNRGFRSQPRTGRDYSKIKCFSCGQFGHMQSRCPNPDASLPFRPAGWFLQSDGRRQRQRKSNGKLPLDRDLTHTGLHVHHSTPFILHVLNHHEIHHHRTLRSPIFINKTPYNQK